MDALLKKQSPQYRCNKGQNGSDRGRTQLPRRDTPADPFPLLTHSLIFTMHRMNVDPKNPTMPDRDRLVLSKGHTAPALYAVLAERGFFPC